MADANAVMSLLLYGKCNHEWSCFGQDVVYDLVPVGTEENIQRAISGLDSDARRYVQELYEIAHAIRSIGGYDFEAKLDEKLKFVRGMSKPLRDLYLAELRTAELKAITSFNKARDELKT